MKAAIWLALAAAALLLVAALLGRSFLHLEWIQRQVRRKFPQVAQMSGHELARRLESGDKVVLIDVRGPDEYAVSHLPGALRVESREGTLPGVDKDATVVAYCSVGWRSSQMAARLQAAGFRRVSNLEGAIFKWVREGRPLVQGETVQGETPVAKVHPYNQYWSFLVPPEKRAFHPEDAFPTEQP